MPPCVSLCLIVKNEEADLPACLESAAGLVDETVVVDTGSTDNTRTVAARFGARVFDFPWTDDFAAARNETLRHATGDWIFWLDADDRIDAVNRERLRALFAGLTNENVGYLMKCVSPGGATGASTMVTAHVRLFRNHPEVRWQYRLHEQILPSIVRLGGSVRWTEVVIQHVGYQDPVVQARKLERNLRILQQEKGALSDDPFTLYNLGTTYLMLGRPVEAIPLLRRGIEQSRPGVPHAPLAKVYEHLIESHRQLGQKKEALAACREGRQRCPDEVSLLHHEGLLRRDLGDLAGAEACLLQLLQTPPAPGVGAEAGFHGFRTRHELALLYATQGRAADAEAHWRAALAEQPDCVPAWFGLADLLLARGRFADVEQLAQGLATDTRRAVEEAVVRGRLLMHRKEFAAARRLLEETIIRAPRVVWLRVALSHVLLMEGRDWAAADRALRELLALDPRQVEARHNLGVVQRMLARKPG